MEWVLEKGLKLQDPQTPAKCPAGSKFRKKKSQETLPGPMDGMEVWLPTPASHAALPWLHLPGWPHGQLPAPDTRWTGPDHPMAAEGKDPQDLCLFYPVPSTSNQGTF